MRAGAKWFIAILLLAMVGMMLYPIVGGWFVMM
jgi:hypothetical protein